MRRFFEAVHAAHPTAPDPGAPYAEWHAWSCAHPAEFWSAVWTFAGVISDAAPDGRAWESVVDGFDRMAPPEPDAGPVWFRGARLNFAENLLRNGGSDAAVIFRGERARRREISWDALAAEVAGVAGALRAAGIKPGDRVAGFLPNVPEAIIAMLATAACGAVWSSCSPDFGASGVLERFGQIEPRVLFAADGYRYGGKDIDSLGRVQDVAAAIPSIERVVLVPFLRDSIRRADLAGIRGAAAWHEFAAAGAGVPLRFERLPFDHPLYVMYSSGTTGLPKCIVHGTGGTLLQHLKEHQLHTGIAPGDRVFYFTTCGWMMWNWLVSALASGATLVLYDGSAMPPGAPDALWRMAAEERVAIFGTSAKFLALCEKHGVRPDGLGLGALRSILSTGSPLAPASYDYVDRAVKPGVHLASISGGTDIISCFALGNPLLPVYRGEIQCRGLGMAVDVFDEKGTPLRGVPGELVCTKPFPSMPVAFWNDPGRAKYRAAYFDVFPGVWRHGDWAEITGHDGVVIHGRSDATLNPGGVRIGTAEIYRQVEQFSDVLESVVVAQQVASDAGIDERIVLFVRLRPGIALDDDLRERMRQRIRTACSPHHVPRVIVQVTDIPRTLSGKITEIAVRDVIHGRPVINTDALANPESLDLYRNLPDLTIQRTS